MHMCLGARHRDGLTPESVNNSEGAKPRTLWVCGSPSYDAAHVMQREPLFLNGLAQLLPGLTIQRASNFLRWVPGSHLAS